MRPRLLGPSSSPTQQARGLRICIWRVPGTLCENPGCNLLRGSQSSHARGICSSHPPRGGEKHPPFTDAATRAQLRAMGSLF